MDDLTKIVIDKIKEKLILESKIKKLCDQIQKLESEPAFVKHGDIVLPPSFGLNLLYDKLTNLIDELSELQKILSNLDHDTLNNAYTYVALLPENKTNHIILNYIYELMINPNRGR